MEKFPRKKITREEVQANRRAGLSAEKKANKTPRPGSQEKRESNKIRLDLKKHVMRYEGTPKPPYESYEYKKTLARFKRFEKQLVDASFDNPSEGNAPHIDLATIQDQLEKLSKKKDKAAFAEVNRGIAAMHAEIERRRGIGRAELDKVVLPKIPKLEEHNSETPEQSPQPEIAKLQEAEPEAHAPETSAQHAQSTQKRSISYAKPYFGPTNMAPGARPLMSGLDNLRMRSGAAAPSAETQPEPTPEPAPSTPAPVEAGSPKIEPPKTEAPAVVAAAEQKIEKKEEAGSDSFEAIGDGENDRSSYEAPPSPKAHDFEDVGDGENDTWRLVESTVNGQSETPKEAREELRRLIETYVDDPHDSWDPKTFEKYQESNQGGAPVAPEAIPDMITQNGIRFHRDYPGGLYDSSYMTGRGPTPKLREPYSGRPVSEVYAPHRLMTERSPWSTAQPVPQERVEAAVPLVGEAAPERLVVEEARPREKRGVVKRFMRAAALGLGLLTASSSPTVQERPVAPSASRTAEDIQVPPVEASPESEEALMAKAALTHEKIEFPPVPRPKPEVLKESEISVEEGEKGGPVEGVQGSIPPPPMSPLSRPEMPPKEPAPEAKKEILKNENGIEIDPEEPKVYEDEKGVLSVYGKDFDKRFLKAQAVAQKYPGKVIEVEAESPHLRGGMPEPWRFTVEYNALTGMRVIGAVEPADESQFGKVDPETFIKVVE